MISKLKEWFGGKKKPKYKAKNFTKVRTNRYGNREVYDSSTDQWILWAIVADDLDFTLNFNSLEDVSDEELESINRAESSLSENIGGQEHKMSLDDFVETHVTESYTPSSYSPSSSSSSWSDSSSSSSYDSSSSSSGSWD